MRIFSAIILLSFIPVICWGATRNDGAISSRSEGASISYRQNNEPLEPISIFSGMYDNVMTIVRALTTMPRNYQPNAQSGNINTGRVSPRGYTVPSITSTYSASPTFDQDSPITNKQQYIAYLKNTFNGDKNDCSDRYNKYNNFFYHDSSLSGQITPKDNAPSKARLDTMCEFLDYSHWCFAMGFAYTIRDFDNPDRLRKGYRCLTYQEFCDSRSRVLDNSKIDEYLSKVIDEIMFYNKNIRNTDKNTVQVTTEKMNGGSVVTSTSWKSYNTDTWIQERISVSEMTRLLCK